jgi:hypothetical protein
MKNDPNQTFQNIKLIGYTSESNKDFCLNTNLYDEVLGYNDLLADSACTTESSKYVVIDIAGKGDTYIMNEKQPNTNILKLLVVGNSSNTEEKRATMASFSYYATFKAILSMMGAPAWIRSWMTPVQEIYLIWDDMSALKREWGQERLQSTTREYALIFCKAAKGWIAIRRCESEESIQKAFTDMLDGTILPSETIVLDVVKAVSHRK